MTSGTSAFSLFKAACKRAQSTLLAQQCWELLRACWQWCANGYNNSQQVGDLPCIATLRFGDHGTKKMFVSCWLLVVDRFQTLRNNRQQHPTICSRVCKRTQHVKSNNVGSCWKTMLRPFTRGLRSLLRGRGLGFSHATMNVVPG